MIIWGFKTYIKQLGNVEEGYYCSKCEHNTSLHHVERRRKFTLFFIPLFTVRKEKLLVCPICGELYSL